MIFERDKKQGGGIVETMPTSERRRRSQKASGPGGEPPLLANSYVVPPWHSLNYAASSRLGFGQNRGFQSPYYLGEGQ